MSEHLGTPCRDCVRQKARPLVDEAKTENWKREAQEVMVQTFDSDNRAYRLAGIVLALIRDREDLLQYISRTQSN